MRIAVVIPDRQDRPRLLEHCMKMLKGQTVQPDIVELVDKDPDGADMDITYRYRIGIERAMKKGPSVILLWENDDWYRRDYIEKMVKQWKRQGQPEIFGIDYTIYYHILEREYRRIEHPKRASAFNTLISAEAVHKIQYPKDSEPFLDLSLWKQLQGRTISPVEVLSLGIKHNVGMCGGKGHRESFPFDRVDNSHRYLGSIVDPESLAFYADYEYPKEYRFVDVKYIAESMEPGVVFVSREFGVAGFICPCGCGDKVFITIGRDTRPDWKLAGRSITPSILKLTGCKSHFYITNGKIEWA